MSIRKVVKAVIPEAVFEKIEPTGHLAEAILANVKNGFPGRRIKAIGVTGTNGKTTTSFFIYQLLHSAGIKVALLSTVATGVNGEIIPRKVHMTTTNAGELQRSLRKFVNQGIEWVVVETSSHALAQHRVWGVPYEIAVMTNLTHDHLDYHKTFERYRDAKKMLFTLANKGKLQIGVVNADDPSAELFAKSVKNPIAYGIKYGDLLASNLAMDGSGSNYSATIDGETYDIRVNIPGEFNVSNSLAAIAVGRKLGLSKESIEKGIASLLTVEGRMNTVDEGQKFKVIVDFASTPDGFEKFFSSVRPLVKGKLVAVFGSAGRRDENKRAVQGEIAGRYADELILTEEDDRDVDGMEILTQIADGAHKTGKVVGETIHLIPSREEAIGFAFTRVSNSDDMVVLLGKGHEKTIERADGEYPWDEASVAREALAALLDDAN